MKPALPERVLMLVLPHTPQSQVERTLQVAEQALQGGVNWLMLRIRDLPPTQCVEVAEVLMQIAQANHALFSVNPYPALALWVGAHGVHLPERTPEYLTPAVPLSASREGRGIGGSPRLRGEPEGGGQAPPSPTLPLKAGGESQPLPSPDASGEGGSHQLPSPTALGEGLEVRTTQERGLGGEVRTQASEEGSGVGAHNLLVGRSVHSLESAQRFHQESVDYLLVGHIFATATHPDEPARGLDWLRMMVQTVPVPMIAIGGITPERVGELLAVGARGVAVLSGIAHAPNPRDAAETYARALGLL